MLYKFRVWNKFDKVMIDKPHSMRLVAGEMKSSEDDILMQFTGLTDKNGVEIYEGDIVYLSGYGSYTCEFPFLELYDAGAEGDIGAVMCNIYEDLTNGVRS